MRKTNQPSHTFKNLRKLIDEFEKTLAQNRKHPPGKEELADLKERVQSGFNRLLDYSGEMSDRLREETRTQFREHYDTIENRLRARAETTSESVRAHPYRTALIAAGILLVVGATCRHFAGDEKTSGESSPN